tara:strand:+ start:10 stop:696 length:687 start_codon:yes stop_codon:yes gene_type:complete
MKMATKRKYAYYIKGNKLAIIQREDALAGSSNDEYGMYKSPTESIADGLEIQYAYTPTYRIETSNDVDKNITQYQSTDGKLSIADNSSAYINYATTYGLAADKYIVLKKAGKFNGLHKVQSLSNNSGTNNKITLTTEYNGSEAVWTDFEEVPELYYVISVLQDETFELDLSRYHANAVVYYLKAKIAEDAGDFEKREFFMREFKRQLEKGVSALKRGPYIVQGFKSMT